MNHGRAIGLSVVLACGSMLAYPGDPAAGAATTPATARFPSITVDLANGNAAGVLPFDTPFYFTGNIPASVSVLSVAIKDLGRKADYLQKDKKKTSVQAYAQFRFARQHTSDNAAQGKGRCDEDKVLEVIPDKLRWTRSPLAMPAADKTSPTFSILMPPLEASHLYQFTFCASVDESGDAVTAFQTRAHAGLTEYIHKLKLDDLQDPNVLEQLRSILAAEVKQMHGDDQSVSTRDSTLDPSHWSQGNLTYRTNIEAAITASLDQKKALELLTPAQRDTGMAMAALDCAPLCRLLETMAALAAKNPILDDQLKNNQTLVQLVNLDPGQMRVLARGAVLPTPDRNARNLTLATSAKDATTVRDALKTTTDLFRSLTDWLDHLSGMTFPQAAKGEPALSGKAFGDLKLRAQLPDLISQLAVLSGEANRFASDATTLSGSLDKILDKVSLEDEVRVAVTPEVMGNYETRMESYLSADVGLLCTRTFAPGGTRVLPYLGTNFYLRPVNKDAPLDEFGGFCRCFSFTLGVTVASISDKTRSDLFGSQSLVLGCGYRLTRMVRLGVGTLWFHRNDPNPLSSGKSIAFMPYVSLSMDFNVAKAMNVFGKIFQ